MLAAAKLETYWSEEQLLGDGEKKCGQNCTEDQEKWRRVRDGHSEPTCVLRDVITTGKF